jgi:2-aminoadipate transaminase
VRRLELAKQAADLHTSQLTQMVVHEVIKDGFLDQHIPKIRSLYGDQCQVMLDGHGAALPGRRQWTKPEGGMFIWVTLPKHIDAMQLLDEAIAKKVAFVPGAVLRQHAGHAHLAPVVRDGAAGTHPWASPSWAS